MLCEIPLGQFEGAVSQCSYQMERNEDRCEREWNRDSQRIDSHHGNEGRPLAPVVPSASFLTRSFQWQADCQDALQRRHLNSGEL
jgi:hypothetical protein